MNNLNILVGFLTLAAQLFVSYLLVYIFTDIPVWSTPIIIIFSGVFVYYGTIGALRLKRAR
jgi:hypothetical protein